MWSSSICSRYVLFVIWYCCILGLVQCRLLPLQHSLLAAGNKGSTNVKFDRKTGSSMSHSPRISRFHNYLKELRGGSTSTVVVSTSLGSVFLDKKKKLTLPSNSTIGQLKAQLQVKFPGSPPTDLQQLYFGNRQLLNEEVLSNITTLPVVPILLDMITGTSAYNKTHSVTQGIDAYVSSVVQLAYLGEQFTHALTSNTPQLPTNPAETGLEDPATTTSNHQTVMKTIYYRHLYEVVNASIYEMYAEDIALALKDEKNPEAASEDTKAWRGKDKPIKSPLVIALAKEFDLNSRGLRNYLYFSIVLMIFAYKGSPTPQNTAIMLAMIPIMWVSKLRHLRILTKLGLHMTLQCLPTLDFLLPLFPAPYQVMAREHNRWFVGEYEQSMQEGDGVLTEEDGVDSAAEEEEEEMEEEGEEDQEEEGDEYEGEEEQEDDEEDEDSE